MNILLVSQCSKNALTETRRVLDQFAERRGERTWQTPITQAGLDTLRRLLRKTARKNTAVACHWIRGRDHSELLWIVGDATRFGAQGAVPTNTTQRDVLRHKDENDWHTGEDICLLAALAALMHDLGKACAQFQAKLRPDARLEGNLYRHEWISLRLFQAFVGGDDDLTWLQRLMNPSKVDDATWLGRLQSDGLNANNPYPFKQLPPLACAVGWLIVTHHRLPVIPPDDVPNGKPRRLGCKVKAFSPGMLGDIPGAISASWNETCHVQESSLIEPYWQFPDGLPVTTEKWRARAGSIAERLLARLHRKSNAWLDNPYVMHLARLALMLGDHYYSSLTDPRERVRGEVDYPLYANTDRATGMRNQRLDEHLLGVEKHSRAVSRALPGFEQHLPRLARHKGFRRRSADVRFRWQDKAYDLAASLRGRAREQGFFGVNMASTGCGKTLANGRIMYALADPEQGARFSIALGLRTLTLQTGQAYRERLHLSDSDLAIRVGGGASQALYEHYQALAEKSGSESTLSLLPEDSYVHFDGNFEGHPILRRAARDPYLKALLEAPILVCTVDHIAPATEGQRGGRQIAPMLRLMSSDLILDEPDDFDLNDLPAITRLVHWAGLLGSRVLLSSATLPPSLVRGLFDAYRSGRAIYQRNRGEPGRIVEVCCAWFDEADRAHADCPDSHAFVEAHQRFAGKRHAWLAESEVRRRSELARLAFSSRHRDEIRRELGDQLRRHAQALHARHHSVDPRSGKRVSFGLIRMANIESIFDIALALYQFGVPPGQRIHLCVYHSQHPLLIRSAMEQQLDQALNRRDPGSVFDLPDIRRRLHAHSEPDQLFVVLGSPVTEVGRDHDYDWAVVEPSSMRSLIQLAGRVRRHREGACKVPNIILLDSNLRHFEHPGEPAFCRPGFEGPGELMLHSHRLEKVLLPEEREVIDARSRILAREPLRPRHNLVDLEHYRLRETMVSPPPATTPDPPANAARLSKRARNRLKRPLNPGLLGAHSWWSMRRVTLTGVLPQQQPFRSDRVRRVEVVLMPEESGEDFRVMRIEPSRGTRRSPLTQIDTSLNHRVPTEIQSAKGVTPWGEVDYMEALSRLAEQRGMELEDCARRFGTVTLPESAQGWRFHPALGFAKHR